MSWTTPRDWTDGEIPDADTMNAHVRDELRYLKGLDGPVTLSEAPIYSQGSLQFSTSPLVLGYQDAGSPVSTEGAMRATRVSATTGKLEIQDGATWREVYHEGNWGAGHEHKILVATSTADLIPTTTYQDVPGLTVTTDRTAYWLCMATLYVLLSPNDNTHINFHWKFDAAGADRHFVGEGTGGLPATLRQTAFMSTIVYKASGVALAVEAKLNAASAVSPTETQIVGAGGQCKLYAISLAAHDQQ